MLPPAITHNDQHGGQNGNFSPDRGPGQGRVDIYWYASVFRSGA